MRMYDRENTAKAKMVVLLALVINQVLRIAQCSQHYRVEITHKGLRVRESTQNPPSLKKKNLFITLMINLQAVGIFKFVNKLEVVNVDGKNVNLNYIFVTQINIKNLSALLGIDLTGKPENVDEKVWAVIPEEIKSRWNRFSPDIQAYIVTCCETKAEDGFASLLETKLISDSKRSPLTFEVPNIPVRLPNPDLESGASNEVYDLVEVIKIRERDPNHPERRLDPMNRRPFDLKDVVPAREMREAIMQQGMQKGPK